MFSTVNVKTVSPSKQTNTNPLSIHFAVSTDGQVLWEKSKKCPNGDAHIQLLEELLSIEKRLLEKTNRYIPMNKLDRAERERLLIEQENKCNHCDIEFTSKDVIGENFFNIRYSARKV